MHTWWSWNLANEVSVGENISAVAVSAFLDSENWGGESLKMIKHSLGGSKCNFPIKRYLLDLGLELVLEHGHVGDGEGEDGEVKKSEDVFSLLCFSNCCCRAGSRVYRFPSKNFICCNFYLLILLSSVKVQ